MSYEKEYSARTRIESATVHPQRDCSFCIRLEASDPASAYPPTESWECSMKSFDVKQVEKFRDVFPELTTIEQLETAMLFSLGLRFAMGT
ncbi:hypothetical protein [Candidatus Sodalis pierantonius]|uniref:hypothetical protein n=1 Tax=Candidatus Sodalis pierantonii TaxID=1486991 RepID=UPI001F47B621|nr:hypothetical protein [Candidatus Sodalis pierantonius]